MSGTRRTESNRGSGRRSAASTRQSAAVHVPTLPQLQVMLLRLRAHADNMPDHLYRDLRQNLEWQIAQTEWSMTRIHQWRWFAVREAARRGYGLVATEYNNNAFEIAAETLADTPAAGGAAAMKGSYFWIKRARREGRLQAALGAGCASGLF